MDSVTFYCFSESDSSHPLTSSTFLPCLCIDVLNCQADMSAISSLSNSYIAFILPMSTTHTQNYWHMQVYLFCPFSWFHVGKCSVVIYSTLRSDWIKLIGTSLYQEKIWTYRFRSVCWALIGCKKLVWAEDRLLFFQRRQLRFLFILRY